MKKNNDENSGPLTSLPVNRLNGDRLQRRRSCQFGGYSLRLNFQTEIDPFLVIEPFANNFFSIQGSFRLHVLAENKFQCLKNDLHEGEG